jgi:exosortase C (VPDSG-CTERM-specific)
MQVTDKPPRGPGLPGQPRSFGARRLTVLAVLAAALTLCFCIPLWQWFHFAKGSEFYSYMPLIPFISGYLIWQRRADLPAPGRPSWGAALAVGGAGLAVLGLYVFVTSTSWVPPEQDYLSVMMLAFLLLLTAVGFGVLGTPMMAAMAMPVALLAFVIPYPEAVNNWLENFFQHTSAAAAQAMYTMVGTHSVRQGILLSLPTSFSLSVDPECSGIHSTQVLLITSLLAGNLFLTSPWRRLFLALFVIPLAIVRNGFRIFVLGELCIHISHDMINTWIHHKGGPIFFALSLIPFFIVLVWLRKGDPISRAGGKTVAGAATKPN